MYGNSLIINGENFLCELCLVNTEQRRSMGHVLVFHSKWVPINRVIDNTGHRTDNADKECRDHQVNWSTTMLRNDRQFVQISNIIWDVVVAGFFLPIMRKMYAAITK